MNLARIRNCVFYTILLLLSYWSLWLFDYPLSFCYDLFSQQKPIETFAKLEEQFRSFDILTYDQLPERKKKSLASEEEKNCYGIPKKRFYQHHKFLKISWFDRYKFLVADYRVRDFLSGSHLFASSSGFPQLDKTQYLLIDQKILYKILELRNKLYERGYSGNQFSINSGFRTPFYNRAIGGKVCSRHQFGDAVDIRVYDVNNDHLVNAQDARIVFELLDRTIIANLGGLGKYKSDSQVLHFDTRGKHARWFY